MAAELTDGGLVLLGWAVMMVAAAVARLRFERMKSPGHQDLAHALEAPELRRGVITVVQLRVDGLARGLEERSLETCRALELLVADLGKLAAEYRGELEAPDELGLRIYLGRYLANPDHRACGLELALRAREATTATLAALDLPALATAVVTDEAVSSPFRLGDRVEARSFGRALRRVRELAAAAGPGEIRVDGAREVTDAGFEFAAVEGGRLLAGRRREAPEG